MAITPPRHADHDEVVRLIAAYRERGDRRAIERILAVHGKLLNHIVRRYSRVSGETYEDLLQVGYLGLVKAVDAYKADCGTKFSSYAYAKIEGELRHHLRDAGLVKKPRWARGLYSRVAEANARLTAELGRPPLIEEIARDVNVTPEGVRELMKFFADTDVLSLDGGRDEETNVSTIRNLRYESFALPIEDHIVLEQALQSLTELQRKVIYLFFYKDLTQTEIGRMLSLPQRKISRILASATKSMRNFHGADSRG